MKPIKQSYLTATLLILSLFNKPTMAESSGNNVLDSNSRQPQVELPLPLEEILTPILPELPSLPPVTDKSPLSARNQLHVNQFIFMGNSIFSAEELNTVVSEFEGREITAEELQEARNRLSLYYYNKGYINSGAILPDQQVQNGLIIFQIIEGQLEPIEIGKNEPLRLRQSYIEKRLRPQPDAVLNIEELQERLQLLQQNRLIKRLHAELGPGVNLGKGVLKIKIEEERPYYIGFRFNNHRSPSVGSYRAELLGGHYNLTGWGDALQARYGLTEGLKDYSVSYSIPLNRYDTTLSLQMERSDSEIVAEPFKRLDIESEAETFAVAISHPWYKKPNQQFETGLKLERRSSKTSLLNTPFPFSPGAVASSPDEADGQYKVTAIRFSQDWVTRSNVHVIAARSNFSLGIDALDSTIHPDNRPDSKFFSWLGQFQWVNRLENLFSSQIIFHTDLQVANQDLLPLEKISVGGVATVRGYRENHLTRDNGLIASLEWRVPLFKLPTLGIVKESDDNRLYLTPFFDYGRSWNVDTDTPEPKELYSVGLGLRWSPNQNLFAEFYWGKALRDVPESQDDDLQDKGIHFEMGFQL